MRCNATDARSESVLLANKDQQVKCTTPTLFWSPWFFSNFLDPPVTFCDPFCLCGATMPMLKSQNLPSTRKVDPSTWECWQDKWQYVPQYVPQYLTTGNPSHRCNENSYLPSRDGYTSRPSLLYSAKPGTSPQHLSLLMYTLVPFVKNMNYLSYFCIGNEYKDRNCSSYMKLIPRKIPPRRKTKVP